jgi:hypothetical protein
VKAYKRKMFPYYAIAFQSHEDEGNNFFLMHVKDSAFPGTVAKACGRKSNDFAAFCFKAVEGRLRLYMLYDIGNKDVGDCPYQELLMTGSTNIT